jgi:3-deoxy-D-manno-octulosonate 8-phosphate phosphatase KdsC-like HAD superfamily phosphatase
MPAGELARDIELAVFDIDGVMTDGRLFSPTPASRSRPFTCATASA